MSRAAHDKNAAFAVMDALTSDDAAIVARTRRAPGRREPARVRRSRRSRRIRRCTVFRAQLEHTVPMPKSGAMRMVWTPYKTALGEVLAGRAEPGAQLLSVEREVRATWTEAAEVTSDAARRQRQLRDFAIVATLAIIIATCAFVAVRNTRARRAPARSRTAHCVRRRRRTRPAADCARRARRRRRRRRRSIRTCAIARSAMAAHGACSAAAAAAPTTSCSTTRRRASIGSGPYRRADERRERPRDRGHGRRRRAKRDAPRYARDRDHLARSAGALPVPRHHRRARPRRRVRRRRCARRRSRARASACSPASPRSRSRRCCGTRGSRPRSSSCSAPRSRSRSARSSPIGSPLGLAQQSHRAVVPRAGRARDARARRRAVRDRHRRSASTITITARGRSSALHNFTEILSGGGRPLDDPLNFWFILGVTVLWTVANIALHVTIGVALALVLSRKWLRGRGVFRMLLILPWAIPNYITALMWKGMFHGQYGAINSLLHAPASSDVSWFSVVGDRVLGERHHEHVARLPVHDGRRARRARDDSRASSTRPPPSTARARGSGSATSRCRICVRRSARPSRSARSGRSTCSTSSTSCPAASPATRRTSSSPTRTAGPSSAASATAWPRPYATIIFLILLLWTVFGTRIVRSKEAES